MMDAYSNIYAQKVYEILVPLIGDMMSKGVIKSQIETLGKNPELLKREDIPILAEKINKGLIVFVGSATASVVASRILKII